MVAVTEGARDAGKEPCQLEVQDPGVRIQKCVERTTWNLLSLPVPGIRLSKVTPP